MAVLNVGGRKSLKLAVLKPFCMKRRIEIGSASVLATAAYTRFDAGAHPLQIKVTYQGCAEAGLCYPPITKVLFPEHAAQGVAPAAAPATPPWEGVAILGGAISFLLAGLLLRKGRKLELPAA